MTPEEKAAKEAARQAAVAAAAEVVREAFAEMAGDELFQQARDKIQGTIEDAILSGVPDGLTGPASPVALARARRLAQEAADSLTRQLAESQLNSMGEKLADALMEGKRPRDIFKELEEVKGLDRNRASRYEKMKEYLEESDLSDQQIQDRLDREYEKLLNERRKSIAQTEGRNATSEARRVEGEARGAKFKVWITSQDDRVSDICAGNESDGVIPIDKAFSSGHQQTPGHPNCRCTVSYITSDKAKQAVERRHSQRIEETKEARSETGKGI